MRQTAALCCLVLFFLFVSPTPICSAAPAAPRESGSAANERGEERDLTWFRDQLHIAPKYQEQQEGILGMSWLHFLTMAFLVLFFVAATVVHVLHTRRKQEIIETLLREEEDEKEEKSGS